MGSRFPSHQLSNGLYVSGRPEQYKERQPTMISTAMPYTGGDIKKSGELGKMFDIPVDHSKLKRSGPVGNAPMRSGSFGGAASYSGPLPSNAAARQKSNTSGPLTSSGLPGSGSGTGSARQKSNSGPLNRNGESVRKTSGPLSGGVTPLVRQTSGPLAPSIPATGLITSGPISSAPLNSSGAPRKISGPLESSASGKLHGVSSASGKLHSLSTASGKLHSVSMGTNHFVTNLSHDEVYSFKRNFPKVILWTVIPLFLMGFIAGGFILAAVQNAILLIVVVILFCSVAMLLIWNRWWGRRAVTGFISGYPDAELRTAKDGQYVKVSGVVTCGSVPLESSYHKISRCVYTSTGLYEYRGWDSKPANAKHRHFTWGLRYLERHVVDFYISDFQSGLRALVKAGYGARVTPYVDESTVVDITKNTRDLPSNFIRWLGERNLSSDDRVMRLKEGYIKEGSTVSVMGVVQRNDNVLMIVPPPEPVSTGCQWGKFLLPASLEGLAVKCEDTSKMDAIPV